MNREYLWKDFVIVQEEDEPGPDGNLNFVDFAFRCPNCGELLDALNDQGETRCPKCAVPWRREGEKLLVSE